MPSTPITITLLPASPSDDDGGYCIDSAALYRELDMAGVVLDLSLVGEAHRAALLAALRVCQAGEGDGAGASGADISGPDTSGSHTSGPHTSGSGSQRGMLKAMAVSMLLLRATREQAAALHSLGDVATPPRHAPVDPTISQSLSELAAACAAPEPEARHQAYSNTALALSMGIARQVKALRLTLAADTPLEQALSGAQAHAHDACVALHALALCHVLKTPPQNARTLQALGLALKGLGRVADAVSGHAAFGPDGGTESDAAVFPRPVIAPPTVPPQTMPDARSAAVSAAPDADGAAPSALRFWRTFVDNIRQAQANLDALHWLANAAAPCVRVSVGDSPESAMLV